MKNLIIILIVLLLSSSIVNCQDYWEVLNTPPDIDIRSIAVNSNGIIYIGLSFSTGGGVLKSIDGGYNWMLSGLQNMGVNSILITLNDIIYAGSGYVYRSIDSGNNWEIISPEVAPVCLLESNNNNLFAGFWGGIYKSDSNYTNWVHVLSLYNVEVVNAIIEDTITGKLYAGTTHFMGGGGVYLSEDGGDTWMHFGLTYHYVSSLAMNSSGDLFAGTRGHHYNSSGGVFVLPAGSEDWINLNNEELVTSIVINSEDNIYIGCSFLNAHLGGVRQSTDNGQTWEIINTGMGNKDIEELILGPEGHLFAVANNSPIPLFKSINSTLPVKPQPSNYPENFSTHNIELQWTDPEEGILPHAYLVLMSDISFEAIEIPIDNVAVPDSDNAKNILYGVEKCTFTNLIPATVYYLKIFPYTSNGDLINYKTEGGGIQTMKMTKE
ncbi:MAG: hypothetical protein JEY97_00990 [Bacteroidales bacterium]|nr:hypothetical protein [Bacteroidales bacterium]